jgi:hypothetical protein
MSFIIKDKEPLVSFILTEYGKKQMSTGKLSFVHYAFGDSDIDYRTSDINSLILKPVIGINDLKYPLYKKDANIFYPMTDEKISTNEIVKSKSYDYNIFTNNNKIINLDPRFIQHYGTITTITNPYILTVVFDKEITKEDVVNFDFITMFLNDNFVIVEDVSTNIIQCQIDNIIIDGKNATIYLKQPVSQDLTEYRFFITSSKHVFNDFQSWNQVFCGNDQLNHQEKRFDGARKYFDLTDGLLIYHNRPLVAEDFDEVSNIDFEAWVPTIIWDKSPVPKMGIKLHTTAVSNTITSPNNKFFNIVGYNVDDEYNNTVGVYYPEYRMCYINDIEVATTLANKNNRNWTLPSIGFEYNPSNGNGIFNKTNDDLYITYQLKGNLHDNTSYCRKLLYIENKKGDYQVNLDFSNFKLPIINNLSWKVKEVVILYKYVPNGGKVNHNNWKSVTMLKGDSLNIDDIKGKYSFNIQQINRGESVVIDQPKNMDEQIFLGNVKYSATSKKYITTFHFQSDLNKSLYTSNPTFSNDKDIRVSEVAVYDKDYKVVAYAKLSHSIKWKNDIVFTIKTQMVF